MLMECKSKDSRCSIYVHAAIHQLAPSGIGGQPNPIPFEHSATSQKTGSVQLLQLFYNAVEEADEICTKMSHKK